MKKIKFKRFPGDTIVVPMLIGVVLNSFVPQALQIGGFFTGIVNGTSALVGVFLLFLGATIDVRSTPMAIKIGAVIIGTKVALAVVLGLGVAFLCNDNFLRLSSLAIISAVSVANNALYSGILLGVVTVFAVGGITVLADKLTGGSGIAGAAISSTAASGVSNPGALAAVGSGLCGHRAHRHRAGGGIGSYYLVSYPSAYKLCGKAKEPQSSGKRENTDSGAISVFYTENGRPAGRPLSVIPGDEIRAITA